MSSRILVTGGSGFIGTNLINYLVSVGARVLNLDVAKPRLESHVEWWFAADCTNDQSVGEAMRWFKPQKIVHLAGRTDLDESALLSDYSVNPDATRVILQSAAQSDSVSRVILTSTMLVHRLGNFDREDADYSPQTVYGRSKVQAEVVARELDLPNVTWLIVRPTTIWGPWNLELRDQFLGRIADRTYLHPARRVTMRSYGFVGNTVRQIAGLLEAPRQEVHRGVFYVGDHPLDLAEYVDAFSLAITGRPARRAPFVALRTLAFVGDGIVRLANRPFPLTSYRLANMTRDNVIDIGRTTSLLGEPEITLEAGVRETVEWAGY